MTLQPPEPGSDNPTPEEFEVEESPARSAEIVDDDVDHDYEAPPMSISAQTAQQAAAQIGAQAAEQKVESEDDR